MEIDTEVNLDATVVAGPVQTIVGPLGPVSRSRSISVEAEESWVDPVVGMQVDFVATDALAFTLRGDIGGFGVGSDFSWGTLAAAKYEFTESASGFVGYRILDIDYDDSDFVFDAQMGGLVLGFMIRF